MLRAVALILCLVCCFSLLPACKTASPLVGTALASLTLNAEKKQVTATVTLNSRDLEAFSGKEIALYELRPGETVAALTDAEPLSTRKASSEIKLTFPLFDGERSRLYSSFLVKLPDGSWLSEEGHTIENPSALATDKTAFLWTGVPKGIWNCDADEAAEAGAMHIGYEVQVSSLLNGDAVFAFCGSSYYYNTAELSRLDHSIKKATEAGLQVSLLIDFDTLPSEAHSAALLVLLTSRYNGGEHGRVSALFLDVTGSDAAQAAAVCRFAWVALSSQLQNGRIYLHNAGSLEEAEIFFSAVSALLAEDKLSWGASVAVTEDTDASLLPALSASLLSSSRAGHASYFAVGAISSSLDEALENGEYLQAAAFADAYLWAAKAGAGLICYTAAYGDENGLRAADGSLSKLTETFAEIDRGLSEEDSEAFAALIGERWEARGKIAETRKELTGVAGLGLGSLQSKPLFDFTAGESSYGFSGVGALTDPALRNSAALSAPVLYTWLEPTADGISGVRKLLPKASALSGAVSLSASLLTQIPEVSSAKVRLRLDGMTTDGKLLSYTASAEIKNNAWQTVTFQIADFLAEADLSRPCLLTLTAESDAPAEESADRSYVMWLEAIDLRVPANGIGNRMPLILTAVGLLLGFLAVLVLSRSRAPRKLRKNRK